jgi:hypothetical protein
MRIVTKALWAAISLTASVALAGCNPSSSPAASPTTTNTATTSTATSAPTASAPASSPAASGGGQATAGSAAAGAAGACQPSDLSASLGQTIGSATHPTDNFLGQDQFEEVVDLTNTGPSASTMDGFPGGTWSAARTGPSRTTSSGTFWA